MFLCILFIVIVVLWMLVIYLKAALTNGSDIPYNKGELYLLQLFYYFFYIQTMIQWCCFLV